MKSPGNSMKTPTPLHRLTIGPALVAAFLLLIPLVAMQFSDGVNWGVFDFVIAWLLIFGAGFTYKLIAGKMIHTAYRIAAGAAVGTALFLVWSNLAVGVIGSENNPANLMYLGVLAVGAIGVLIARFQPHGMSQALFSTAFAQAVVTIIALTAGLGYPDSSAMEIIIVNGFFIVLWTGSGLLFQYTAWDQSKTAD